MCRPDVNLVYTYEWSDDPPHFNMSAVTETPAKCVNWNTLDTWLRTKNVNPPYTFVEPDWLKAAKGEV